MMVLLYANPETRVSRVRERSNQRFGQRVMEGGDMYQSNLEFLEANRRYESDGSPNLQEQREWRNGPRMIPFEHKVAGNAVSR